MSEIKRYPWAVLKLQHFDGFNEHFEALLPDYGAKQAYDLTEDVFFKWFAYNKYSGYDSFRKIRERKILKNGTKSLN